MKLIADFGKRIGTFMLLAAAVCLLVPEDSQGTVRLPETNTTITVQESLEKAGYVSRSGYSGDGETEAATETLSLHAKSALLLDGESGRVLYEKDGFSVMPMASTTKIMTCILALELGNPDDLVTVSGNASAQPEVRLGLRKGEQYRLGDLLYSLMLESHNDAAVAIAEHIGGSVEGFAGLMNQKARDIGCFDTYFITPNGLDSQDEAGQHSTTAENLARILRYAIDNPEFLEITRTPSYTFTEQSGKRTFSVNNKNAFLQQMEGALSGKTGFTNGAGYCYAGALRRDDRTFIAVVLACGWPPNKSWKWADVRQLMDYGLNHYENADIAEDEVSLPALRVENGVQESVPLYTAWENKRILKRADESVTVSADVPTILQAPVEAGSCIGNIQFYLGERLIHLIPVYAEKTVEKWDFTYCLNCIAGYIGI